MSQFGSDAASQVGGADRLWYLDWIRGYAMLLGVPFHVGLIYSNGTPWFVSSAEKSQVVSVITGLLTSVRMPLFFYVAGLLSAVVLSKRDPRIWLARRVERLAVPLLVSTLVISPTIILSMAYAASRNGGAEQFRAVFLDLIARPGVQWIGHLWFLQVLLFYSIASVALLPAVDRLKRRLLSRDDEGQFRLSVTWVFAIAAAAVLQVFAVNGLFAVVQAKFGYQGLLWDMLKVEAVIRFLPYFLIGLLMKDVRLPPIHRSVLAWSIIGISVLFMADHWNEKPILDKAIRYTCMGTLSIVGGCMILVLSARFVTGTNRVTSFLAASAFTVYLFHYPIVVWLGTIFYDVHWPPVAEYLLLISVTLALTFLIHLAISRSRTLTYLFNGERRPAGLIVPPVQPSADLHRPWVQKDA